MMSDIPVVYYGTSGPHRNANAFWWQSPKKDIHKDVFAVVERISEQQKDRATDYGRYGRLYSNSNFERHISGVSSALFGNKLTFNVCKACVDTACAKISGNKTRPMFLTEKGSKKQQNKAKKLTQYIDGCFQSGKVYDQAKDVFRDACIFGTGALKVYEKEGQAAYERTFINEIVVDEVDGRLGNPRQLHQVRKIHRELLKEVFADDPEALQAINGADAEADISRSDISDMIKVVESWHLPSSKDASDGKHTICVENSCLLEEEWKHPFFPFVFFRWSKPILGFYGNGLVSELVGIQLEINLLLLRIKEAQELMAVPRIFVEESSSVNTSHINDEIGGIIKYRGTEPRAMTWQAMSREIYDYLEYLFRKGFEVTGISQLSASSKKPAGLDSGVALREFQDIETERFSVVASDFQQFFIEAAKVTVALQRELAEQNPKLSVNVPDKKFIQSIKWKEVDLEDDKYIMQVFPTNFLPKTPEGKLQFVQELIQSGFIEPDAALSLLDFPDLEAFFNLKTAAIDDIQTILDRIIEDEEYTAPEKYMNLQLAIQMGQAAYLRAKVDGTSETSLELLQRFIDDSQAILQQMTPPPPSMLPPQGQPTAQPETKPNSDLMPLATQP
jgi:hypothetical protein